MKNIYAYLLPARSILFFLIFIVCAQITKQEVGAISSYWSIIASIVNIITIAVLVLLAKLEKSSYPELINYHRGQSRFWKTLLLSLSVVIIGMAGMYLAGFLCYGALMPAVSLKMIAPIPKGLAVINLLVLPVSTTLAEDGLYLGGGVGHIRNKYLAVIVPACFYALQHCFIPTLFDIRYMAYRFFSFLPLTVIFCLYYRKKREPLPIMIGHTILDLATAGSILATSMIPGVYEQMESMM